MARVGAAAGPGTAAATAPALRRNDNPRSTRINTSVVETPLTVRTQSGGTTPLRAFARVATELSSPAGVAPATPSRRGVLGSVARVVRLAVGVPEAVPWLQRTMRTVRGQALGADAPADANRPPGVSLSLRAGAQPDPVSRFWQQASVAGQADLGPHHHALAAELDVISTQHGPHVGLGLSLALLAVQGAAGAEPHGAGVLRALHGDDGLVRLLSAVPPCNPGATNPDLRTAMAMLQRATRSNQFDALAQAMVPALQPAQRMPLRRFLEADAVMATAAARAAGADAAAATGAPSGLLMAQRVRAAAQQALLPGAPALSDRQTVESFYWDNHFRDDGPGSDLESLQRHFADTVRELGHEPGTGGVLSAAYRFGLAGADRHLLTDEAGRLGALRDGAVLDTMVDTLRAALQIQLDGAHEGPDTQRPNAIARPIARPIAQMLALESWAPEHKASLSLEEMVRGREFSRTPDAAVRDRIAAACNEFVRGPAGAASAAALSAVDRAALPARVLGELSLIRLGFDGLQSLARELGLRLDGPCQELAQDAATLIEGHTRRPGERTPEAVGAMVGDFLSGVYFGNHIKLSHASTATLSTRGLGVNATSALESGFAADTSLAVVPLLSGSVEQGKERVFRAGAATHGVEIFLGQDVLHRRSQGVGTIAGYPNDDSLLARFAVGLDLRPLGLSTNDLQGVMLRVDRKIVEDHQDEHGAQVFRQNEDAVRTTAAGATRMLFERAPLARSDQDRHRLLEDLILQFHGQGLSMTLMKQQAETQRSDFALGTGVSVALGNGEGGLRIGASVNGGVDYGHHTAVTQKDTTGSYQVNNLRTGWSVRRKVSAGVGANAFVGAVGLPPTPLLRGSVTQGEGGGTVRVRAPTRQGRVVSEKTFSDTETADPRFFKDIVLADRCKWVDLFAFQHRNEPDPQACGDRALNEFFHTIESMRAGNHVYYARERLHPEVGQRLDELTSLASLAPASLTALHGEIAHERGLLAADDRSWGPASLIAYERNSVQQGAALSAGVQGRHVSAVEGEREFIFKTPGWTELRARENMDTRRPGSLDDVDRRAATAAQAAMEAAAPDVDSPV